jgi:hypothetical protein
VKGFTFSIVFFLLLFGISNASAFTSGCEDDPIVAVNGSVIDLYNKNLQFVKSFSPGYQPLFAVFNQDKNLIYSSDPAGKNLNIHDISSGIMTGQLPVQGKILAAAYDSARRQLLLLNEERKSIQIYDTSNSAFAQEIFLGKTPVDFRFSSQKDALIVSFTDSSLAVYSAKDGHLTGELTDLDAVARKIFLDESRDLLILQHEKFISVYQFSTLRFVDYIPLEAHPLLVQVCGSAGKLAVQVEDDPETLAVFDLKTLHADRWYHAKNKTFQGRKIDASNFVIDQLSGEVRFLDTASRQFFTRDQTMFGGPVLASSPPPNVTPSPDIHVNENIDNGPQVLPNAEFDGAGNFVIDWTDDNGNDGDGEGVYVREYNFDLTPVANEYRANDKTHDDQGTTGAAVASNGDFTLIWRDTKDPGDDFGAYLRLFNKGGTPKGPSFLAAQTTTGRQMAPSIAGTPDGKFIAAWSGPGDGNGRGTFTRRFDNQGNPLENETLANTSTNGNTWAVDVTANNSGDYVVVWRDDSNDRIRGRAFHADGTPVGGSDFQAGPLAGTAKNFEPSVAVEEDRSFIVVWRESSSGGIVGQKFDSNENPIGTPFVVTSQATGQQYAPAIAMAPDGRYVVVWRDGGYATDDIVARMFDANGTALGPDFVVPADPSGDEFECFVAMDDAANFIVVYKDRDGQTSIAARYFSVGPPPVPMTVSSASPTSANRTDILTVTINGTNFTSDAAASFNDTGVQVTSTSFINATTVNANITILPTAFLGLHDITVTTGSGNATGQDLFAVKVNGTYPAPTVATPSPISGDQSQTLNVDITGADFANDPALLSFFGTGITVNSTTFINGNLVRANITISPSATPGPRDVSVVNPGGATGTCTGCFTVIFNPTLYSDSFDDADASDWTPTKGTWTAASNALVGNSASKATNVSPFTGCSLCTFEADIKRGTNAFSTISFIGWYVDKKNLVELILNKDKGKWILKQRFNGATVAKTNASAVLQPNVVYHVKITFDGTNFLVFVDGAQVITLAAGGTPNGTVAVRVKGTFGTFDNIKVTP